MNNVLSFSVTANVTKLSDSFKNAECKIEIFGSDEEILHMVMGGIISNPDFSRLFLAIAMTFITSRDEDDYNELMNIIKTGREVAISQQKKGG